MLVVIAWRFEVVVQINGRFNSQLILVHFDRIERDLKKLNYSFFFLLE